MKIFKTKQGVVLTHERDIYLIEALDWDYLINRDGQEVFSGQININQMKRSHKELIGYLFREMSFPQGVFLMTGTCLVPPNEFTLAEHDVVSIQIEGIGTLTNTVSLKPL